MDNLVSIYNTEPDTYLIEETINPTLIKKFADERKQTLNKIVSSGEPIKYIPRTSQVKIAETPEIKPTHEK